MYDSDERYMLEIRNPATPPRATLEQLARLFLRLGLTAFGGPAAHLAMMRDEVVERSKWLTNAEFIDLIGAANLIPGPSSTEVALYIGYQQAGWPGIFLAGICFILPAFLIVFAIAWAYMRFGQIPQAAGLLIGIKPVVIAVIAQALWNLGRTALKSRFLITLGVLSLLFAVNRLDPLAILIGAGFIALCKHRLTQSEREPLRSGLPLLSFVLALAAVAFSFGRMGAAASLGLKPLFLVFVKLGSVVYGSGYVLLAFLRTELVTQRNWLTSGQLLDAVAVGQMTPGPVFTTATFIGYVLAGPRGAVVATLGIFMPAFFLVGVTGPLVARIRSSPMAGAFLDGVNVSALALMAVVAWQLGQAALINKITVALAIVSAILLIRFRINSAWLVLGGGLAGVAISYVK